MLAFNESSPLTISASQVLAIPFTINKERMKENRQIATASTNMAQRNVLSDPPSTFCVLILRIRMGTSALLKFVKLIPAMTTINTAMVNNTNTIVLLPLSFCESKRASAS